MSERPNKLKEQLARVQQRESAAAASSTPRFQDAPPPDETQPATDDRQSRRRPAGGRRPAAGQSWDDRVKRATFYVDRDLLDDLDRFCARHELNKSEVVREAIARYLKTYRKP